MVIKLSIDNIDNYHEEALSEFIKGTIDVIVSYYGNERVCCFDKKNKAKLRFEFSRLLSEFEDKEMPF